MSNNGGSSKLAPAGRPQSPRPLAPPIAAPAQSSRMRNQVSSSDARAGALPKSQNRPPQAGEPSDRLNRAPLSEQEQEGFVQRTEALLQDIKTGNKKLGTRKDLLMALRSLVEFKEAAEAIDEDRDRWLHARRLFIQKYGEARPGYEIFTQNVRNECEQILKSQPEAILHQEPSSRTKKVDSLEKKVKMEIPHLRSKGSNTSPMEQLRGKIKDLAGIRILVYFPDDVSRVVKAIENSGTIDIESSGVSYSRNRTDHRAVDKSDQSTDHVGVIYTYGAFREEVKSLSTDEIVRRWKNSGYRAVHLQVKMIVAEATEIDGADPEHELYSDDKSDEGNKSIDNDVLSASAQTPVRDTKGKGPMSESSYVQNGASEDFQFPEDSSKVAEIQISTVVMHAWSQVEHDLIYKNPHRIPVNDTMARMLDAINGLSINSELLLEELQRTVGQAQREANERNNLPFSAETFTSFLQTEYLDDDGGLTWQAHPQWVSVLSTVACSSSNQGSPGEHIGSPAKLKDLVTKHRILANDPEENADLAVAVLKAVGTELRQTCLDNPRLIFREIQKLELDPIFGILYKCMVVANAFSIMVAIDGQAVTNWFDHQFPDRIDQLRKVNSVILGIGNTVKLEASDLTNGALVKFVDDFCNASSYETHNVAVALASLYFHIERPTWEVERLEHHENEVRNLRHNRSSFRFRPKVLHLEPFHTESECSDGGEIRPVVFLDVLGPSFAISRGFVDDSSWSQSENNEQEEHPLHDLLIFGDSASRMDAWENSHQFRIIRTEDDGSAETQSRVHDRMQLKSKDLDEVCRLMMELTYPLSMLNFDEERF